LVNLLNPKYGIVDVVDNGRALQESFRKHRPDAIVTDITMPLMNGLEAIRQLQKEGNSPRVVFLTMHHDIDLVRECFRCGGSAFVTKERSCDELIIAIEAVLKNHTYVSPGFPASVSDVSAAANSTAPRMDPLTSRQREILQLFAEGKTMKTIATIMNLSTRTVEWHKYRMMQVLNVQNSAELVRYALRTKLVA